MYLPLLPDPPPPTPPPPLHIYVSPFSMVGNPPPGRFLSLKAPSTHAFCLEAEFNVVAYGPLCCSAVPFLTVLPLGCVASIFFFRASKMHE